ncbi:MAG TPA: hypothetical protein VLM40_14595, partial [Gemmata sp.]|nr:hypothetical protein [Gemmata sp.]
MVLLSGSAAGGYYARTVLVKRETARDTAAAWSDVQEAHRKIDLPAMQAALDRVLAANPDDPAATRYKQILNRGEADPDTPDLALLLMRHHLRAGSLPDAAREAEKFLAVHPKHWRARCTVARHALAIQKDPLRAKQILEFLTDPEEDVAQATPGDVLDAISLFEAVGRDATSLRKLIVRRVAPMMRSAAAASASPVEKSVLIACYL